MMRGCRRKQRASDPARHGVGMRTARERPACEDSDETSPRSSLCSPAPVCPSCPLGGRCFDVPVSHHEGRGARGGILPGRFMGATLEDIRLHGYGTVFK